MLERQSKLSTSSVDAVGDNEVELLCLDHTLPAAPLQSFDLEMWNLHRQSVDELLSVPISDTPQLSIQAASTTKFSTYHVHSEHQMLSSVNNKSVASSN